MKKINPILTRYIIIFWLFALSILLLFIPVYLYIYDFTLKNELSFIKDRLRKGIEYFDFTVSSLNNTAFIISTDKRFDMLSSDPRFISKYGGINPNDLQELRRIYSNHILPYSIIADSGLIFSRNLNIFSAEGRV